MGGIYVGPVLVESAAYSLFGVGGGPVRRGLLDVAEKERLTKTSTELPIADEAPQNTP